MIIGIDEAGRGALAGPLVVVALGSNKRLSYAKDSKQVSPAKRQILFERLLKDCDSIGIGWASNSYIDRFGLSRALTKASRQAISGFSQQKRHIIIDGKVNFLGYRDVVCLPKADSLVKQVSAASIVAKVTRDRWMKKISKKYPHWKFDKHFGYGTKEHMARLTNHEPTPIHRKSFAPLKNTYRPRSRTTSI